MSDKKIRKLVVSALMAALTYVATMVIRIPSPMNGYVNLGDCFVLLSGWLLGPWYGGAAAGIGSMLTDLLSGYGYYAPGTFIIKGLDALVAALIFNAMGRTNVAAIVSGVVGEIIMVVGYFGYAGLDLPRAVPRGPGGQRTGPDLSDGAGEGPGRRAYYYIWYMGPLPALPPGPALRGAHAGHRIPKRFGHGVPGRAAGAGALDGAEKALSLHPGDRGVLSGSGPGPGAGAGRLHPGPDAGKRATGLGLRPARCRRSHPGASMISSKGSMSSLFTGFIPNTTSPYICTKRR